MRPTMNEAEARTISPEIYMREGERVALGIYSYRGAVYVNLKEIALSLGLPLTKESEDLVRDLVNSTFDFSHFRAHRRHVGADGKPEMREMRDAQ